MLTWLANLLSGGRLDRTERRVEELERERDYAWGEFRAESERTEWQAEQHLRWRELHHRAVQQRDQAGKDLARANASATALGGSGLWMESREGHPHSEGQRTEPLPARLAVAVRG